MSCFGGGWLVRWGGVCTLVCLLCVRVVVVSCVSIEIIGFVEFCVCYSS